jgi:hypothetical protein
MPGPTRFVAASAALNGGASLGEVLRLGIWFNALTYFRSYHALLGTFLLFGFGFIESSRLYWCLIALLTSLAAVNSAGRDLIGPG